MTCCCSGFCGAAEQQFTAEKAGKELQRYRSKGPIATTRLLRDGLADGGLITGTLLDIGAGIGALTCELLERGMSEAVAVDASAAYLAAARALADGRAVSDRIRFVHADFLQSAHDLPSATVVTLDRVVCCYPLYQPLLEQALGRAVRGFAISYPRDRWYVRALMWLENARRRRTCGFRTFVHPPALMERIIREAGFERVSRRFTFAWTADVFARRSQ